MSVLMCHDDHLLVLAFASMDRPLVDLDAVTRRFVALHSANAKAYAERYRETDTYEEPGRKVTASDYMRLEKHLRDPVTVLKLAQSYDYQATDYTHYHTTDAFRWKSHAVANAIRQLPGYEDKPWSL